MRSPSPLGRCLIAILLCALVLEGCGTVFYGASQRMPVTSSPPGAMVFVDGRRAGIAPCVVHVDRKHGRTIRIEKDGYDHAVIKLSRNRRPGGIFSVVVLDILGGAALGLLVGVPAGRALGRSQYPYDPDSSAWVAWGPLIGVAVAVPVVLAVDFGSRPQLVLSPTTVDVILTKAEGQVRTSVIEVDAEQLAGMRSIRVRFSDGRR